MIKQRKREELYDRFRQGAIPSGADFADLIKSQLNLLDDGLAISENADDPICFRAHGEGENYLDLADAGGEIQWRLSGYNEAVTVKGLNFSAAEQSKLFIERETGNIGINTDGPLAKIHLVQISATDALRIDDTGNDQTPLIVTSEGQVGLGTPSPAAKLHLSYSGSGDILRVDDTEADTTPLIVNDTGNVGLGYSNPQAKLTVAGGLAVGANRNPGSNNLYVAGNIEVAGTAVFSGGPGVGGIEINAPLTSRTNEVTIKDNVVIRGADASEGSGNLSVAGNTTLGTYQAIQDDWNVLTVNGRIRTGGDLVSGAEQYGLELNDIFTVDRTPANPRATLNGGLTVTGNATLGDSPADNLYLNGTVKTAVTIDADLTVSQTSRLSDAIIGNALTVSNNVTVGGNLTVSKTASLTTAVINSLTLNSGATVNKISMDNTLSGNGNATIPTEKAVKEYVDNQIGAIQIIYA
jgi:hypothetical protein